MRHVAIFLFAFVAFFCGAFELPMEIACCPAPREGEKVVNADQTVLIIWDPVSKTEHFIRQATFKSKASDFGFLIPTPTQPELDESVNAMFPMLADVTKPEVITKIKWSSPSLGCGEQTETKTKSASTIMVKPEVRVLEEKIVAGLHAIVLEADTAGALAKWLNEKGFALTAEIEGWAKPYVDAHWKITAFKVPSQTGDYDNRVDAPALRMSFKTDRPLFPYREPDYKKAAELTQASRLLRIYFISDARYQGDLTPVNAWTGKVAWSNKLNDKKRSEVLDALKLPANTLPAALWLTEFEDPWPYTLAPADVYFSKSADQSTLKRPPIIYWQYRTIPLFEGVCILSVILFAAVSIWRFRARRRSAST